LALSVPDDGYSRNVSCAHFYRRVIQAQASLLITSQLLYILYHPRLYLYHNLKDIKMSCR